MLKSIGSWRHSQSLLHQSHLIVSFILQLQSIGKELKTKWLAQLISTHRARRTKCAKIENKRRRSDFFLLLCRLFFCSKNLLRLIVIIPFKWNGFQFKSVEVRGGDVWSIFAGNWAQEYLRTAEIEIHVSKWDSQLLFRCLWFRCRKHICSQLKSASLPL